MHVRQAELPADVWYGAACPWAHGPPMPCAAPAERQIKSRASLGMLRPCLVARVPPAFRDPERAFCPPRNEGNSTAGPLDATAGSGKSRRFAPAQLLHAIV